MYRIRSVTRPEMAGGLLEGYATGYPRYFTRQQLEALDAEALGFYIDDFLVAMRGEERHTEEFVLQGGVDRDNWVDIKPIIPLLGEGDEPDYGDCVKCGDDLDESEFAVSDTCMSCRIKIHEREQELIGL